MNKISHFVRMLSNALRQCRLFVVNVVADVARCIIGVGRELAIAIFRAGHASRRCGRSTAFVWTVLWCLFIHIFVAFNGRIRLTGIRRLSVRCDWGDEINYLIRIPSPEAIKSRLTFVILLIISMRAVNWLWLLVIRARLTRWIHVGEFSHIELAVGWIREDSSHLLVEVNFIFVRIVALGLLGGEWEGLIKILK